MAFFLGAQAYFSVDDGEVCECVCSLLGAGRIHHATPTYGLVSLHRQLSNRLLLAETGLPPIK